MNAIKIRVIEIEESGRLADINTGITLSDISLLPEYTYFYFDRLAEIRDNNFSYPIDRRGSDRRFKENIFSRN